MTLPDYTGLTLKEKEELRQRSVLRPPLRFPEFTLPWRTARVEDVFDKVTAGKHILIAQTKSKQDGEYCYPVYSSQTKNYGIVGYYNQHLFEKAVVWTNTGYAGVTKFIHGKFFALGTCGVLLSEKGYCNNCIAEAINKMTHLYVTVGVQPKLMAHRMAKVMFSFPEEFEEQNKISKLMQDIDDIIFQADQYLQNSKLRKEAILEKVFPTNLDNPQPEKRFEGFTEKWLVAPLSELATINPKSEVPEEFIYVDLGSVKSAMLLEANFETKESAPAAARRKAEANDIFFQKVRPNQKNNYFFKEEKSIPHVFAQGYAQIRASEKLDPYFLFANLHSEAFVKKAVLHAYGTAYPIINDANLGKQKIAYPASLEEQKKIATLIRTIDTQIETAYNRLQNFRKLKKALIQQMFV
ncbi:hypothetical protein CKF54_01205 [Psittacicella hinzii]|uniref:Type I restriction modification DNA specificity domain-containing protein n=1 Tax=Psittacicella hinzii TaxID=2028575 RepID=A0A3A1YA79_9GAMM|nr:restriction endonuclease subunit S [Psittacicella hinzii]RIY34236.1 hypothetical protein CKF54_01205 [Psittacicella hinzii]